MDIATPSSDRTANVLVVDDDPLLADLIAEWVREKWVCEAVNSGSDALAAVDERTDVVLLDRQMPGLSGEETLNAIRDREFPVQVMMVSGVEPDVDLVDVPIDDYLRKPVNRPALQSKIEALLLRRTFHPAVEKFFVCAAKLDALEAAKSPDELAADDRYLSLKTKADELRQAADATLGRMTEHVAGFHDAAMDD